MPATFTTQSQMPAQHGTVQVLPARPCVPLPCPGLSCLCARSGLVVLGCDLGSDWEDGSALLLLRSRAGDETFGSSCADIPCLVPPCHTDLRCAAAAPHLAAGCWAGAGYPSVPGPMGEGRALPAWGPVPTASAPPPAAAWHPGLQSSPVPFSQRHQRCKKNVSWLVFILDKHMYLTALSEEKLLYTSMPMMI